MRIACLWVARLYQELFTAIAWIPHSILLQDLLQDWVLECFALCLCVWQLMIHPNPNYKAATKCGRTSQYTVDKVAGREARTAEKRLAALLADKWKWQYSQMVYYVRVRMQLSLVRTTVSSSAAAEIIRATAGVYLPMVLPWSIGRPGRREIRWTHPNTCCTYLATTLMLLWWLCCYLNKMFELAKISNQEFSTRGLLT